jgi:hypothetical protein
VRLDQRLTPGVLPGARRFGVLAVLGGHPLPGREGDDASRGGWAGQGRGDRGPRAGHGRSPSWTLSAAWRAVWAAWALSRIRSKARAAAGVSCGGSSGSSTRTCLVVADWRWARRGRRPGPAAGLRSYAAGRRLGGLEQGLCGLPVIGVLAALAVCLCAVSAVPGPVMPMPGSAGVPSVELLAGPLAGCGTGLPLAGGVVPIIGHRCRCRARRLAATVRRQGRQTRG